MHAVKQNPCEGGDMKGNRQAPIDTAGYNVVETRGHHLWFQPTHLTLDNGEEQKQWQSRKHRKGRQKVSNGAHAGYSLARKGSCFSWVQQADAAWICMALVAQGSYPRQRESQDPGHTAY